MKQILSFFRSTKEGVSIEDRIFVFVNLTLLVSFIFSFFSNLAVGISWPLNAFIGFMILFYSIILFWTTQKKSNASLRIFFVVSGFIFLIPGWFLNGGIEGSTPYYAIFFLSIGTLILPTKRHLLFCISIVLWLAIVLLLEAYFPNYVIAYPNNDSKKSDLIISIFAVTIIVSLSLILFKRSYETDKKRLLKSKTALQQSHENLLTAKHVAENATEAKTKFLANMSHEIRTPLNAIIGITELLKQSSLTVEQKDLLQTLQTSSNHLLDVINDVLDISKIEADKLDISEATCDVTEMVKNVISITSPRIASLQKNINLTYTIEDNLLPHVLADESRLKQILVNLVGNAIKFTESGSVELEVSATLIDTRQQELLFSVIDTGIGISKENLKTLFIPFKQIDSSATRLYGGTGLGLSICKKLVEMMGGRIWVTSIEGSGSCFSFSIPTKIDDQPTIQKTEELINEQLQMLPLRILVAEDNLMNQLVAQKMFENLNYTIDIADNGLIATQKAATNKYDLIFMDIQMPQMDGIEATKQILVQNDDKPVIIAMTANAMKEDEILYYASGMKDFLPKPFTLDKLKSTLIRWSNEIATN